MRGAISGLAVVLVFGVLVCGCYPEPMTLEIVFPFEDTFLYSSTAKIQIFSPESESNECAALMQLATYGIGNLRDPVYDSGDVSVCDLRDGGYRFDDIGEGERYIVVTTRDRYTNVLLQGCNRGTTGVDAEPIRVVLSRTTEYQNATEDIELTCRDMTEKCTRGC